MTTDAMKKIGDSGVVTSDDMRLLEMLSELQDAPEPETEKIVHHGTAEIPAPIVRTDTTSAGFVWLRRNSDGSLKEINRNQLADRLKQKLADGRPAWISPKAPTPWTGRVKAGTRLCLLNPEHPDYAHMEHLGLIPCPRRGPLANESALRRHMVKKHRDAWDAIQRDKEIRREEMRDSVQANMASALTAAMTPGAKSQVIDAPVAVKEKAEKAIPTEPVIHQQECEVCHEVIDAKGRLGLSNKVKAHMKTHSTANAR